MPSSLTACQSSLHLSDVDFRHGADWNEGGMKREGRLHTWISWNYFKLQTRPAAVVVVVVVVVNPEEREKLFSPKSEILPKICAENSAVFGMGSSFCNRSP